MAIASATGAPCRDHALREGEETYRRKLRQAQNSAQCEETESREKRYVKSSCRAVLQFSLQPDGTSRSASSHVTAGVVGGGSDLRRYYPSTK